MAKSKKSLSRLDVVFCLLQGKVAEFSMMCRFLLKTRHELVTIVLSMVYKDNFPYDILVCIERLKDDAWFRALQKYSFWIDNDVDLITLDNFNAAFDYLLASLHSRFDKR